MVSPFVDYGHLSSASYEGDSRLLIWTLAWDSHAMLTASPLFDANMFHPASQALAWGEQTVYVGLTRPVLAAMGLWTWRKRPGPLSAAVLTTGAIALALSFGPAAGWSPYDLFTRLPAMSLLRAPARFALLVMLALALLAGVAIADLRRRLGRATPALLIALALIGAQRELCDRFPRRQTAAVGDTAGLRETEHVTCRSRPVPAVLCRHARSVPRIGLPALLNGPLATHRERLRTAGSSGSRRHDGLGVPLSCCRCDPAIVRPASAIRRATHGTRERVKGPRAGSRNQSRHHLAGPFWR